MKRTILPALLCTALAMLLCAATAEGTIYVDDASHCWHSTRSCALARNLREISKSAADYPDWEVRPCAACVPDETAYSGIEAWERGGTVVIRVPDSYLRQQMEPGGWEATASDALIHEADTEDGDIARLLHGRDYLDYLENAREGQIYTTEAYIPDCMPDGLLMNRRHIGAAWYLTVRPSAPYDGGSFELPFYIYRDRLEITRWPAGATLSQAGGPMGEDDLTITPKKSGGKLAFKSDDDFAADAQFYVVRDDGVNILVVREKHFDPDYSLTRRVDYCHAQFTLQGYADGEDAVYCGVISDSELAAMRDGMVMTLNVAAGGTVAGEAAPQDALQPDYAPASAATLPDGTRAAMDQPEYPVGTAFVSVTLTRPAGGIAGFGCEASLERLQNGSWTPVGDVSLRGRIDGDPNREHDGWFCDAAHLVYPTTPFGALREGLYRLLIDDVYMEEDEVRTWLEFRVREGAPTPAMPAPAAHAPQAFASLHHATPHDDPAHYNSCTDNSVVRFDSTHTRLLSEGTMYELLGIDESWGWGIGSHYSLFAWPEGHPEQARLLAEEIDHGDVRMYDAGDGLLLVDNNGCFYRCDYEGGGFVELGRPFAGRGGGEEAVYINDLLPVGDGIYMANDDGVWYTKLDNLAPERVYRAQDRLWNGDEGTGYLVYVDGTLLAADGGIVAVDTLGQRGTDGLYPARRLTEGYDSDDGDSGFGYIALNGRLYCWSESEKATVSVALDGGDLKKVSDEHFWFHQVTPGGVVLALTGSQEGMFGDTRTAGAFYYPNDPANPAFDPDHSKKRDIAPDSYDYIQGDWLYAGGEREKIE